MRDDAALAIDLNQMRPLVRKVPGVTQPGCNAIVGQDVQPILSVGLKSIRVIVLPDGINHLTLMRQAFELPRKADRITKGWVYGILVIND